MDFVMELLPAAKTCHDTPFACVRRELRVRVGVRDGSGYVPVPGRSGHGENLKNGVRK